MFKNYDFSNTVLLSGSDAQYAKYHHIIEEANENYQPCNNTNNACFKHVIIRDLKPFKEKGINKDLIDAAKARYVY